MNKKSQTLKEDFIEAVQSFKKKDFKNTEIVCYKILSIDAGCTPISFENLKNS